MALDAIVIGAGPNGLAAAIELARAGRSVRIYEAADTVGGGTRSAELTEPGVVHDVCAAIHSMALASPFLNSLPLSEHGLEFIHPIAPCAHPLDDGTAVIVHRSVDETADGFSRHDGLAYRALIEPFVERASDLMDVLLAPIGIRHPVLMARFGLNAIRSAQGLATRSFADERTRAMFAGVAAHGIVPLDMLSTAGYGLTLLIAAHAMGWPVVRGGSGNLGNAMASYFRSLGGEIITSTPIESLDALPPSRAVLCNVTPRQLIRMAGARMPEGYRKRLERFRHGPGVFKMDWLLNSPVPWRAKECTRAATIHIGGTLREIALGEEETWSGRTTEHPYMIVVQPTLIDSSRAPTGRHTLWAYCHVPNGSTVDMRERMERQIERFAPGFLDCIVARSAMFPADMERRNANLIGGDIAGGATDLSQVFTRPIVARNPYVTPMDGIYLCSSSTSPGIGVHGMSGYYAARTALARTLG